MLLNLQHKTSNITTNMNNKKSIQAIIACCFLAIMTFMTSCNKQESGNETPTVDTEEQTAKEEGVAMRCTCPPVVQLQPCNTFTEKQAEALIPSIKKALKENLGYELDVEVLPNVKLPETLKNDNKSRYRAEKIINHFPDNDHNATIIILHDDISATKGDIPDWGVQGLSIMSKKTCVASDFRVKDKSQFWKVMMHEFFHSFCKLHHCAKNDPTCLIREGAMRSSEKRLCADCKAKIKL